MVERGRSPCGQRGTGEQLLAEGVALVGAEPEAGGDLRLLARESVAGDACLLTLRLPAAEHLHYPVSPTLVPVNPTSLQRT